METEHDKQPTDDNVVDLLFEDHVCVKPVPVKPKATKAASTKTPAGPGSTKARPAVTRKPTEKKVKKAKVEIEFEKLPPKEQLAFLKSKMPLLVDLEAIVTADETGENNPRKGDVQDGKQSDEASTGTDGNLCMLRLELGSILASEAELRGKEKKLRLAIKREQRRLTMAQSPIKCDTRETRPATAIVQLLFVDEVAQAVPPRPLPKIAASAQRLWRLAQQTGNFEEEVTHRLLDVNRDATLSTTADLSMPLETEGSPLRDSLSATLGVSGTGGETGSATHEELRDTHAVLASAANAGGVPCFLLAHTTTSAPVTETAEAEEVAVPDIPDCGTIQHSSSTHSQSLQWTGTANGAVEMSDMVGEGRQSQSPPPFHSQSQSQATALQYVDEPSMVADLGIDGASGGVSDVSGPCDGVNTGMGRGAEAAVAAVGVSLFKQFAFRDAIAISTEEPVERPQLPSVSTLPLAAAQHEEAPRKLPTQPSILQFLHAHPPPPSAALSSPASGAGASHCASCEVVDLISPEATPMPAAKPQGSARGSLPIQENPLRPTHRGHSDGDPEGYGPPSSTEAEVLRLAELAQDGFSSSQPPRYTPSSSQLAGVIHYIPDHEDGAEDGGGDGSQHSCRCPCSQESRRRDGPRHSRHPAASSARREPATSGTELARSGSVSSLAGHGATKTGGGGKANEESQSSSTSAKSDTSHILNSPELPDFASMPVQKLRDVVQHYGLKPDTKGRMVSLLRSMWQRLHREGETKRAAVSEVRFAQAVRAIPPAAQLAQDKNLKKKIGDTSSGGSVTVTAVPSKASIASTGSAKTTATRVLGEKRRVELCAAEVAAFIKSRPEWYEQVLSYTPLDLDRLHAELNGHLAVASVDAAALTAIDSCEVSVAGPASAVLFSQSISGTGPGMGTGTGTRISKARLLEILDSEAVFVSATQKPKRVKR